MKYFFLAVIALLFTDFAVASSITVSGKVSGTWNVDTVNVTGDLLINADTSLIIMPGSTIIFQGHYQVFVQGVIHAEGNVDHLILFTMADTTGFADTLSIAGGWHGFIFNQPDLSVDTSSFSFCRFEYGKAVMQDTTGIDGGVFRIFNWNKVVITDCEFFHNLAYRWGGAIYARYADVVLLRNVFRENSCGTPSIPYGYGGGFCSVHSKPVVQHCLFEDNSSTGVGGGASFEFSDPVLQYNIFHQNLSGLGGALGYLRSFPTNVVSNNLFYENEARFFGGGICCIRCNTVFSNNTLTGNHAIYGGGVYANDSAFPSLYNTIFHGNYATLGQEVYIFDINSAPNFLYCDISGGKEGFQGGGGQQGYHGIYENNLDTIPGFTESGDTPFALLSSSPLSDEGTPDTTSLQVPEKDLGGNTRIYNGRIDIGAYEWNPVTAINSLEKNGFHLNIIPNPVQSDVSVTFKLDHPDWLTFYIFSSAGRLVWQSDELFCNAGVQNLLVTSHLSDKDTCKNGLYILRTRGKNIDHSTPFIFIR